MISEFVTKNFLNKLLALLASIIKSIQLFLSNLTQTPIVLASDIAIDIDITIVNQRQHDNYVEIIESVYAND